jgi:type II secretory pathway component GspD/PulD (secretin)
MKTLKTFALHSVCWLFLIAISYGEAKESRVFEYAYMSAEEVRDVLSQVLTPTGKIVVLPDKRKVLVQDTPEVIELAAAVMASSDKPRPNVRVEVMFNEQGQNSDQGGVVRWNVDAEPVRVGNRRLGRSSSINVDMLDRNVTTNRMANQFLVVQSGHSAAIRVVTEVPYYEVLYHWALNRGYIVERAQWTSVGTQLSICPRAIGNTIDLELMPEISALENNRPLTIRYRDLATRVTVANGQTVQIGGFQNASADFNREFFTGIRSGSSTGSGGFSVRATIMQP